MPGKTVAQVSTSATSLADSPKKSPAKSKWWSLQYSPDLATLGVAPIWTDLDSWQETISKETFEKLLDTVYANAPGTWKSHIEITENHAAITMRHAAPEEKYLLRFAETDSPNPPRFWRPKSQIPTISPEKPLGGMKIALDPGHLGGSWAKFEERFFQIGNDPPVQEGDMVLKVAKLLSKQLTDLGATVSLIRSKSGPVTPLKPENLTDYTNDFLKQAGYVPPFLPELFEKNRSRIFCVNAEIRARAAIVNEKLQPDLVLALHFNGEPWGEADKPVFSENNHLHVLIHGCLEISELANDDERFEMLIKLLQRTHETEKELGTAVAASLAAATGLPPFQYFGPNARRVNDSPYVWARNLLASRIYRCPVIYLEPHVMNHALTYKRIQAGSYSGLRSIDGIDRPDIFSEYATATANGLR